MPGTPNARSTSAKSRPFKRCNTALRLAKAFGTSPDLWLSLQNDFDVQVAKRQIGKALDKIAPVITVAA